MKCLVHKCKNQDHQGYGYFLNISDTLYGKVGHEWICCPCWDTIIGQNQSPQYSQVYRNVKEIMFQADLDVEEYYHD